MTRKAKPIENRLTKDANGCWIFEGSKTVNGYGQTRINGKTYRVHRIMYEKYIGVIPDGFCVCHTCDVRACCNPEHLFIGTIGDNMKDKKEKGRHHNSLKTHCSNGHEFTTANTRIVKNWRQCKICASMRATENTRRRRLLGKKNA